MVEAELPDGTILEFPDGTDQAVIQRVVKQRLGVAQTQAPAEAQQDVSVGEDVAKSFGGGLLRGAVGAVQPKPSRGELRLGTLRENIIGEGEVDTAGEYLGQAIKEGGAAMARGLTGLASLPEFGIAGARYLKEKALGQDTTPFPTETRLGGGLQRGMEGLVQAGTYAGQKVYEVATGDSADDVAFLQAHPDIIEFKGNTVFSPFISTAGEFYGGGPLTRGTGIAAVASETAGQVAQEYAPEKEVYARFFGALAPSVIVSGNKTLQALTGKNYSGPTLKTLEQEKDRFYNLLKFEGVEIAPNQINNLKSSIQQKLSQGGDYVAATDDLVNDALKTLDDMTAKTIKETGSVSPYALEKIKRRISAEYLPRAGDQTDSIFTVLKGIDDTLFGSATNKQLVTDARRSNNNFYKAKVIDTLLDKQNRQMATQRFGGDKVASYKRAMNQIINSPSRSNFFGDKELELMRTIVDRKFGGPLVNTISRFSLNRNGFMAGFNMMAAAVDPTVLGLTAIAGAAGKARDTMIDNAVQELRKMAAAGGMSKADISKQITKQFVIDLANEAGSASRRAATIQEQ